MTTKNINFSSFKNYMKRDTISGSVVLDAPSNFVNFLYVTTHVVPLDLGGVPIYRCYYEPLGDGSIWPAMGSPGYGGALNPLAATGTVPGLICSATATALTMTLFYTDNTTFEGVKFPLYWVIYRDYTHD